MVQWVSELTSKSDDLSSIPSTYIVEGENQFPFPRATVCTVCPYKLTNFIKLQYNFKEEWLDFKKKRLTFMLQETEPENTEKQKTDWKRISIKTIKGLTSQMYKQLYTMETRHGRP